MNDHISALSLQELGVIKTEGKNSKIFETIYADILTEKYESVSKYAKQLWDKYNNYQEINKLNVNNGKMLEYIIAVLLYREKLTPFYMGTQLAFVPNVNFDILLYSKENGPITLSVKTSLRERYKQADLEAVALKNVHRNAKNYLLTADSKEAKSVKLKNDKGELMGGLNDIIDIFDVEFDDLIEELKQYNLTEAGSIEIIQKATGLIK